MYGLSILEAVIRVILALVGILLPGAAVLVWFRMHRRGFVERAAVAFGLGISIIALAALLGRVLGFSYSAWMFLALEGLCALTVILGFLRKRVDTRRITLPGLLALGIFSGVLALRFFQARNLAFPPWVDSVHHAFLVRIFVEQGGLPADLLPWLPIPFYYHYGFHSAAAVFAFISGLGPDTVLLIFGQILNAAVALSVYRLSMALRRDTRRALLAMALTGFVAQMPAFYLAWGRYTLLAGMALLPLAMAEAVEYAVRAPRRAGLARLVFLTAGVLLTHYLAGLMLALFLLLFGCSILLWRKHRRRVFGIALAAILGAALALPWLIPMLRNAAPEINVGLVTSADSINATYFTDYAGYLWRLMGPLRNYLFLALAFVAMVAAMIRKKPIRVLAIWGAVLGIQALPFGLHVAPFRPDHLVIVLFLPAAVLLADGWIALMDYLQRRKPGLRPQLWVTGLVAGFCVFGIWDTRDIVRPATVFADSFDREAVLWAAENTPADSVFLINVVPWQNGLYRGVDGGWWLLPLADRQTLLPPMLYSFAPRDYVESINLLAAQTNRITSCSPEFWALVEAEGVTHIYLREDAGSLKLSSLLLCKGLERVFLNQKVGIFMVTSGE